MKYAHAALHLDPREGWYKDFLQRESRVLFRHRGPAQDVFPGMYSHFIPGKGVSGCKPLLSNRSLQFTVPSSVPMNGNGSDLEFRGYIGPVARPDGLRSYCF